MEARALRRLSVEEYVALDRADDARWEYVNGEAFAMAGGTPEHAVVVGDVYSALKSALAAKPCLPFLDAQKIATVRTRAYHYPDASVVCPPFTRDAKDSRAPSSSSRCCRRARVTTTKGTISPTIGRSTR